MILVYIIASDRITIDNINVKSYVSNGRLDVLARSLIVSYRIGVKAYGIISGENGWLIVGLEEPVNSEKEFVHELMKAVHGRNSKVVIKYNGEAAINGLIKKRGLKPIILAESGLDISGVSICEFKNQVILLGTHVDPPDDIIKIFRRYGAIEVSIGPLSLFTSHSILYYTWAYDRRCGRL